MKLFSEALLLQNLYEGTQLKFLWERSASRLHEISSKKYLEDLEKK
jgi:predicted ATPase